MRYSSGIVELSEAFSDVNQLELAGDKLGVVSRDAMLSDLVLQSVEMRGAGAEAEERPPYLLELTVSVAR